MILDRSSPVPLYAQVRQILEEKIISGDWLPGDRLPSESALCEQFNVSRITIRQALAELQNEERVTRDAGRGTFVTQPRITQRLTRLTGFTQEITRRGQRPGSKVLEAATIPASGLIAHRLRIEIGEEVVLLKRLRTADSEPLAIETAYLPSKTCPGILDNNFKDRSLYQCLTEKFGIVPTRAVQQMEALACPESEAEILGIPSGSPVLHIYRTTISQEDQPFELVESFYRGDKYVFQAELRSE